MPHLLGFASHRKINDKMCYSRSFGWNCRMLIVCMYDNLLWSILQHTLLYINQWGIMIQISIEVASKLIRQYVSRSSNLAMWPCLPQPSHWPLPCQWSVAGRCETAVTIQLKRLGCPSRCHRIYGKPSKSLGQVMWLSWSLTSSSWHWCINDLCLTVWNPLVSWPSMATVLKIKDLGFHTNSPRNLETATTFDRCCINHHKCPLTPKWRF